MLEAEHAAANLLKRDKTQPGYTALPVIVYSQPNVARVGVNTNFFDLLRNIQAFSSSYSDSFSSVKVPDVLVDGIHVSG